MGNRQATISVIGNCQSMAIGRCLSLMLPGHRVIEGFSGHLRSGELDLGFLLRKSGTVLVQTLMLDQVRAITGSMRTPPEIVVFPEIYFTGFHPDMLSAGMVRNASGAVPSAMGLNHSAICLYGWLNGLTAGQVVGLFNGDVYRHLGYFDHFAQSRRALLDSAEECGLDLSGPFDGWMKSDCFMHCVNHPTLPVMADVARQLLPRLGLKQAMLYPEKLIPDPFVHILVWAFYPEIAEALGKKGEYIFSASSLVKSGGSAKRHVDLEGFVEACFKVYADIPKAGITVSRFKDRRYEGLKAFVRTPRRRLQAPNPYRDLPDHQFWERAVARLPAAEVDPVVRAGFTIGQQTRVATAGSCFAQNIARTLKRTGYNYYVPEDGAALSEPDRVHRNFGVFSARYGNIYTARQLNQLFDRAHGTFKPVDDIWEHEHLGFVDAFRPQVEPEGFPSPEAVRAAREEHFAHVRAMFRELEVFVFTLGLTEGWASRQDGAVYPVAPGVSGGRMDEAKYAFVNFTVEETVADLDAFLAKLRGVNPGCRVILTVSPVPLVATYEPRHVLVSTTFSKSVLRVAADVVARAHEQVDYFPSFEIITGNFSRGAYYEGDLRSVTEIGVDHVMRMFLRHYSGVAAADAAPAPPASPAVNDLLAAELREGRGIVCDEEAIAAAAAK
jgi:hypothetical protein